MKPKGTYIEIKMTWAATLEVLLMVLENGKEEGRKIAREELRNMAKVADLYVKEHGK